VIRPSADREINASALLRLSDSLQFFPQGAPFSPMTATGTTLRPSVPIPGRRPTQVLQDPAPRQQLLDQASLLFARASQAADEGDVPSSARLILEALDCERRAGGVGPQVLQLIKPRG
jgi:hypothetical protein